MICSSSVNLMILSSLLIRLTRNCFQQTHHFNYLFLPDQSQIKIPLIPLNCQFCQLASQIDIQLIDEQFHFNRTIQRIEINLKTFEIEESSYLCLISHCPIFVEYGSDILTLNITSSLFSHLFLKLIYSNESILCSIATRFAIYSLNHSLTCTNEIHLHPRFNFQISRQLTIVDCQFEVFANNFHVKSIRFHPNENTEQFLKKSTEHSCEYILENRLYFNPNTMNELTTKIRILPLYNSWNKEIQIIGPCRTKFIPYRHMFFEQIRKLSFTKGQSVEIECPIDGSKKYIKYSWYYENHQMSTNRTIILRNLTRQMQGKYTCIADDENETFEFELNLLVSKPKVRSFNLIIIFLFLLLLLIILISLLFILIIHLSSKISTYPFKPNAYTIHHNVQLTIQHISSSFWYREPYESLKYIDEKPILIRQRNVNRQMSVNIPLIHSTSDMTLSSTKHMNEMKILKISIPCLNEYSLRKCSSTTTMTANSFDSQFELKQFNEMSLISMDSLNKI